MIPAVTHYDPVMGVDIHYVLPPGSPSPVPLPHPFIGMIFDPVDYLPSPVGATVYVNGVPAAVAGTGAWPTPSHIPIGGPWAPPDTPQPGNEGEMFMGSSTVTFDGFPASYGGLPVLTCQGVGMPPPPRPNSKKSTPSGMVLPTSTVMPVPKGAPVLVGGAPTISLMALGMRAAMSGIAKGLGKGFKKLKKGLSKRLRRKADDLMDDANVSKASRKSDQVKRSKCTKTGHPVDVATGKVFTDDVDLELPGPLPLTFERVWTSTSTYEGPLGHGWHHSYGMALWEQAEGGVAVVRLQDGRHAKFALPTDDTPRYNRQEQLWLRRTAEGYRLEEEVGDRRYVFGQERTNGRRDSGLGRYRLARVEDQNGNSIRLRYDRQGNLETIFDSAGRRLSVDTDRKGRITRIGGPHPDDPDRRVTLLRYRYDHEGDLVEVTDALGEPYRYEYDNHLLVKETDRAGVSFYFEYDGTDEEARCVRTWGTDGIYARELSYDSDAQTTTVIDTRGAETVYHWNDMGLVTKEVGPKGNEETYTYDEDANKLSETDALGNTTEYEYDERGRLVTVTNAEGNTREVRYDEEGNIVELTDEQDHAWQKSFDEKGNLTAVTDPKGSVNRYKIDGRGLPTKLIDPHGEAIHLEWDGMGNLTKVVDRTGAETELEYDHLGSLVQRVNAEGGVTRLHRDVLGRITVVENAQDRRISFSYDASGNLTAATDPLGRTRTFGYGAHGPGGVLDEVTEPSGATTHYEYDKEGNLIAVQDATGRTWTFDRDETGRVIQERDFAGRRLTYAYDEGGRLVEKTNGRGETTQLERDAMGRLTERTYADGQTETFAYDPVGRLVEAINDAATVEIEYDSLGRIVAEVLNGNAVEHRYDATGNRIERSLSEGRTLTFDYDEEGRLQEVKDSTGRLISMKRDGLGREVRRTYPSKVKIEREYSRRGELLSQRTGRPDSDSPLLDRQYTYDTAGQLQEVIDNRFGKKKFEHDVDGYLKQVVHPEGELEQFLYDKAGNVRGTPVRLVSEGVDGQAGMEPSRSLTEDEKENSEERHTIAATGTAEGWMLTYDPDGNLIQKHNHETEYRFYYNAAGRMELVQRDGEEVAQFAYDALGRRVRKDTQEKVTIYRWQEDQVLSEMIRLSGSEKGWENKREYVYADFEPLAALSEDRDLFFETDQVNMPRLALDEEGKVVWESNFSGFGKTKGSRGSETVSLRYPGQQKDKETCLYYNFMRYYDPSIGIYTKPDPIGITGGMCTYNYTLNPISEVDPYGLKNPKEISLGLSNPKKGGRVNQDGLSDFSDHVGAEDYRSFEGVDDPSKMTNKEMGRKIEKAMRDAEKIHFNLEGINAMDVLRDPNPKAHTPGSTNWELSKIINDPNLKRKTTFWKPDRGKSGFLKGSYSKTSYRCK
jgi:RHS repeat-associated protein